MVSVTRNFADRLAEAAELLETDEVPDEVLRRLTGQAVELVPGGTAAAVTIAMGKGALTFAASDRRLDELHNLQFGVGDGPVVETLRHNEPRRIDDATAERRWPVFCRAAAQVGFASCLALPLRTDRQPAGAVALYGEEPGVFCGAAHDIALLFAAQGGTTIHNVSLYSTCRRMASNLQAGLESRAVIEQAKGILHAELGVSVAEAFHLLSRYSQNTNQRVRKISAELVQGRIVPAQLRPLPRRRRAPPTSWLDACLSLVFVRGGDLTGYLLLRPHSTAGPPSRAETAGLVERTPDPEDRRVVRVRWTAAGDRILQKLTPAHLDRLHELAAALDEPMIHHRDAGARNGEMASKGRDAAVSDGKWPLTRVSEASYTDTFTAHDDARPGHGPWPRWSRMMAAAISEMDTASHSSGHARCQQRHRRPVRMVSRPGNTSPAFSLVNVASSVVSPGSVLAIRSSIEVRARCSRALRPMIWWLRL